MPKDNSKNSTGISAPRFRPPSSLGKHASALETKPETKRIPLSEDYRPLVSAIIPSYNKAPYLREAVESIIAQDYPKIEIIIVNDGSPDNTSEVARKIIADFPARSIRLIEKANGGISDARNCGISQANGELILTIDGDDMAKPSFVSRGLAEIVNGASIVCSDVEIFGAQPGEWSPNKYETFCLRYDNSIPTLALYKKELWEKTGGYSKSFAFVEDWDFWIKCSRYEPQVAQIDEKLFRYRSNEDGLAAIFTDSYAELLAMVTTANQDLYPVEEVTEAHSVLARVKESFINRYKHQLTLHPEEWLLHLWLGLSCEKANNIKQALLHYSNAVEYSKGENWQPIYRTGALLYGMDDKKKAIALLHRTRLLRPDMCRNIDPIIEDFKDVEQTGRQVVVKANIKPQHSVQ